MKFEPGKYKDIEQKRLTPISPYLRKLQRMQKKTREKVVEFKRKRKGEL